MTQQDLLQAASQLNTRDLEQFVSQITDLYHQRQTSLQSDDQQLLIKVHRSLSPQVQQRWNELIEKRNDENLTSSEYDELLQLTEDVEELNVQRLEALTQLAVDRGVDLRTVMHQLNIPEPSYD
jgi:hypothetical protein